MGIGATIILVAVRGQISREIGEEILDDHLAAPSVSKVPVAMEAVAEREGSILVGAVVSTVKN